MSFINHLKNFIPLGYVRFILLANSSDNGYFWSWDVWHAKVLPHLVRLMECSNEQASVQCGQLHKDTGKEIKFGRLVLDSCSSKKWCHDTPGEEEHFKEWRFVDLQVFMPPRSTLIKQVDSRPNIFIQVKRFGNTEKGSQYDQVIFISIRASLYHRFPSRMADEIAALSKSVSALNLYSNTKRAWSLNEFEAQVSEDFWYPGIVNDPMPDLKRCRRRWKVMDIENEGQRAHGE